ncbi:hypothetical protein [Paenibacillus sp. GCM10012306]|uniref:hypothetical protein n=1 Tax=Paenibacillus sp. GCM10012306 TaxID=3317342 RepID=UPI0036111653
MNKKPYLLAAVLAITIGVQAVPAESTYAAGSGSSTQENTSKTSTTGADNSHSEAIYKAAQPLLSSSSKLPQAIKYLNSNLYAVTSYRATMMTLQLENLHKAALGAWENKFSRSDVQRQLAAVYKPQVSMVKLAESVKDPALRTLLETAGESGYKLETAEGTYFPVIDYGAYRKYKIYVMKDISDYITMMAAESDLPSAKDNGLVIAWTEVAARALAAEQFTRSYPKSNRITAAKQLYTKYTASTFYGLNNTPLFHYDNLEMDLEAQKAYASLLSAKNTDNSPFLQKLEGFMKLLKENGYLLDDKVEQYRSKEVPLT